MLGRQRDLHPDKYASGGEGVVGLAKELSGRVNMAYETLADPLKRAEYIVSCRLRSDRGRCRDTRMVELC